MAEKGNIDVKKALEELNLYRKSKKRLMYIKHQIAEFQSRMFSLGGGNYLGVEGGNIGQDDRLNSLIDKLRDFKDKLLDEELHGLCVQNDIERKIFKLKEPYCSVLRGYYVEGKRMEALAIELHYTFDSVKQIKSRGVKEYAKLPPLYEDVHEKEIV